VGQGDVGGAFFMLARGLDSLLSLQAVNATPRADLLEANGDRRWIRRLEFFIGRPVFPPLLLFTLTDTIPAALVAARYLLTNKLPVAYPS
jgi:hypothetical protein